MSNKLGNYKVIKKIALGGISEIYLAYNDKGLGLLNQKVVIKKLLPQYSDDPKMVKLIHYEARLLAALNHGNIVHVIDNGIDDNGDSYLVQEFIDGTDLKSIFEIIHDYNVVLDASILFYIVEQILRGLVHVHELKDNRGVPYNIIHRDISPTNIMISMSGDVKLLDFGLSKRAVDLTVSGNLAGKIPYMAPEQFNKSKLDPRIDIFALGTVLYELSTGKHRFDGYSDMEILYKIREHIEENIEDLATHIPSEMIQVFKKAGEYDLSLRYTTTRLMLDDLMKIPIKYPSLYNGRTKLQDFMQYYFGATKIDSSIVPESETVILLKSTLNDEKSDIYAEELKDFENDLSEFETKMLITKPTENIGYLNEMGKNNSNNLDNNYFNNIDEEYLSKNDPAFTIKSQDQEMESEKKIDPLSHWAIRVLFPVLGILSLFAVGWYFITHQNNTTGREVLFKSNAKNAVLYIDSKHVCQLPCKFKLPKKPGEHNIKVRSPGYFPFERLNLSEFVSLKEYFVKLKKYQLNLKLFCDYPGVKIKPLVKGKAGDWIVLPVIIKQLIPGNRVEYLVKFKHRTKKITIDLPTVSFFTYKIDINKLFNIR